MNINKWLVFPLFFGVAALGATARAQGKTLVVEEIVARVNNEIITTEDVEHARTSVQSEVQQECQNCTPQQVQVQVDAKGKNLLRDLIDQSLLAQRAKDIGIKVDTEVIKRLDGIRQQYKLADMDALEKEVTKSGQDYEDFKKQIQNQLLTQELIRKEVGSRIITSHEDVVKYYNDHKSEFVRPETVVLREIFVSTEGKPAADILALRKRPRICANASRKMAMTSANWPNVFQIALPLRNRVSSDLLSAPSLIPRSPKRYSR
jgi:parvulin-like peptidyl-prolyl isomerase